ncbi:MAG TPA: hypothetical protein VES20_14205, partial [Bryobacteraceae bacterium]|nr:hypothetical protein [Bryobacteraceae bacterium]
TVRVEIAGVQAGVEYAGQAPEAVARLVQLNVLIGPVCPTGAQPVTIQVGDCRTRTGVTLFIS